MSYNPYVSRYSSYGNGSSKLPYSSSNYSASSLSGHEYPYYSSGNSYLQNGLGRNSGKKLHVPNSGRYGKSLSVSPERFSRSISPSRFGGAKTVAARPKTSRLPHSKSVESLTESNPSKARNFNGSTDDKYVNRYESASSLSDSRLGSTSSLASSAEADDRDYRKLYYEEKEENERLRAELKKKESELEKTKEQLKKALQNNAKSDTEKKERRALERKLSEMEEEVKSLSKVKNENEKLKAENRALTRTVSKLTKKS